MQEFTSYVVDQSVAVGLCIYLLWDKRQDKTGVKTSMRSMSDHLKEITLILRERMPDHKIITEVR